LTGSIRLWGYGAKELPFAVSAPYKPEKLAVVRQAQSLILNAQARRQLQNCFFDMARTAALQIFLGGFACTHFAAMMDPKPICGR
jgi:hypothetical protein